MKKFYQVKQISFEGGIYVLKASFINQVEKNAAYEIFYVSSLRHCQLSLLISKTVNMHVSFTKYVIH